MKLDKRTIAYAGNFFSILLFLLPLPAIHDMYIRRHGRSNLELYVLMYQLLSSLLNCSFWVLYAANMPDAKTSLILYVNLFGMVVGCLILVVYYIRTTIANQKSTILIWGGIGFAAMYTVTLFAYTFYTTYESRADFIGKICVVCNMVMYICPFFYIPFTSCVVITINGALWAGFSILDEDMYSLMGNCLGFAIGSMQLLMWIFKGILNAVSDPEMKLWLKKQDDAGMVDLEKNIHD